MSQVVKTKLMNASCKMLISIFFIPKPPRYSQCVPRYMVFYPTHDELLHILSYIDLVGHSYDLGGLIALYSPSKLPCTPPFISRDKPPYKPPYKPPKARRPHNISYRLITLTHRLNAYIIIIYYFYKLL